MPIETDNHLPEWRPIPKIGESDMEGDKGVDPDDNAPGGEQPLYRPHAFALGFGDNGATVAFGQLLWRLDVLLAGKEGSDDGADIYDLYHTRDIGGLNAAIPKLITHDGDPMEPSPAANRLHGLGEGAYGDVYLYWKVEPENGDIVTQCYVSVADNAGDLQDLQGAPDGPYDHLLTNTGDVTPAQDPALNTHGFYRVKIGTVNVGDPITQNISSDVYWSALLLEKDSYAVS